MEEKYTPTAHLGSRSYTPFNFVKQDVYNPLAKSDQDLLEYLGRSLDPECVGTHEARRQELPQCLLLKLFEPVH